MNLSIFELIDIVRTETENLDVTETIGIKDLEIIRYLNIAQRQLQSKLVVKSSKEFSIFSTLTKSASTDLMYNMPIDCFMRSKITALWVEGRLKKQVYVHNINVEDSGDCGNICNDFYFGQSSNDSGYAIVGNKVYLTGMRSPASDPKVFYVQSLPELNMPLVEIDLLTSVNLQGGQLPLTVASDVDSTLLKNYYRYSLVDSEGVQTATNIKIQSFDSLTRQIILSNKNDSKIISSTEELYLVRGASSSTHSSMEPLALDYLTRYAVAKLLQRNGSTEYNVHSIDLVSLLAEILEAYSSISDDVMTIPQFPED